MRKTMMIPLCLVMLFAAGCKDFDFGRYVKTLVETYLPMVVDVACPGDIEALRGCVAAALDAEATIEEPWRTLTVNILTQVVWNRTHERMVHGGGRPAAQAIARRVEVPRKLRGDLEDWCSSSWVPTSRDAATVRAALCG